MFDGDRKSRIFWGGGGVDVVNINNLMNILGFYGDNNNNNIGCYSDFDIKHSHRKGERGQESIQEMKYFFFCMENTYKMWFLSHFCFWWSWLSFWERDIPVFFGLFFLNCVLFMILSISLFFFFQFFFSFLKKCCFCIASTTRTPQSPPEKTIK